MEKMERQDAVGKLEEPMTDEKDDLVFTSIDAFRRASNIPAFLRTHARLAFDAEPKETLRLFVYLWEPIPAGPGSKDVVIAFARTTFAPIALPRLIDQLVLFKEIRDKRRRRGSLELVRINIENIGNPNFDPYHRDAIAACVERMRAFERMQDARNVLEAMTDNEPL